MKIILSLLMATAVSVYYDRNNGETVRPWLGDELVVKLLIPVNEQGMSGVWTLTSNNTGILLKHRTTLENGTGVPGTMYQVFSWLVIGQGATEVRMQYIGSGVYDPPRHLYSLQVVAH
jgi:hypothetical protein